MSIIQSAIAKLGRLGGLSGREAAERGAVPMDAAVFGRDRLALSSAPIADEEALVAFTTALLDETRPAAEAALREPTVQAAEARLGGVVDRMVTTALGRIDPAVDRHLAASSLAGLRKAAGPAAADAAAHVNGVASRLQRAAGREAPLNVSLIESPEPQAFSLGGGEVGVSTGLVEAVRSEDELAGVIAHELAHDEGRDVLRAALTERVIDDVTSGLSRYEMPPADREALAPLRERLHAAAFVDAELPVLVSPPTAEVLKRWTAARRTVEGALFAQEFTADAEAARLLDEVGYAPEAVAGALERLPEAPAAASFLEPAAHPPTSERLAAIARVIADEGLGAP